MKQQQQQSFIKKQKAHSEKNFTKAYLGTKKDNTKTLFNLHTSLSKLTVKSIQNYHHQSHMYSQICKKQKQLSKTSQQKQTQWVNKRIKSLRKISLNIKKMQEIFKTQEDKLPNSNPILLIKQKTLFNHDLAKMRKVKKVNIQYQELEQELKIVKPSKIFNVHTKFQFMAGVNFKSTKGEKTIQGKNLQNGNLLCQKPKHNEVNLSIKKKLLSLPSQNSFLFDSPIKKHKHINGEAINTLKKFEDSLKVDSEDLQKTVINQIREMRKTQNLFKQPKQWHFHNFFNLNNIQLYQTNLKISCQGWAVIDFLQLKFIRGWHPKQVYDFSPMIRLLIIKCFQNFQKNHNLNLSIIKHRINYKNIKERVKMHQHNQNKKTIIQQDGFTLRNHTIIDIKSLIIGMCRSNKIDLMWCLIYLIGYLIHQENIMHESRHQTPRKNFTKHFEKQKDVHNDHIKVKMNFDQPIYFQSNQMLLVYQSYFILKAKQIVEQLQLTSVQIISNGPQQKLFSNSLDISVLFMSCLKFQLFKLISLNKVNPTRPIKYQVGWNYWQSRNHTFNFSKSYLELLNQGYFGVRDICQDLKYQCSLVYNPQKQVIFVMGQAKINMYLSDVKNIQKWIQKTVKRFSPKKVKQQKLCKTMKYNQMFRSKTQILQQKCRC